MLTYKLNIKSVYIFQNIVNIIKMHLKQKGYKIEKTIIEWCLYDDNIQLDKEWIDSNKI